MRKFATPTTAVPGARGVTDPKTHIQLRDKKGRPIWEMPKPVGIHETTQVVKLLDKSDPKKPRIKKVKQKTQFPVYRGMSAKDARYARAQFKRAKRKLKEKGMAQQAIDSSVGVIKSVLNPAGGIHGT